MEVKTYHLKVLGIVGLAAVLLLALFLITELDQTAGVLGVPLDDAWIHYQFARNLSQGNGFSYNTGEPTPGSTSPLWTLLLAGIGLFTDDFLLPSLILSAFFFLLTIGLTYGFSFSLSGRHLTALLAALGVTFTGRLLWAGLAGMETTTFAAFTVLAMRIYSKQGLRPLSALLFGLASQFRPEGHALFALAAIDSVWDGLIKERLPLMIIVKTLILPGLIYGGVVAPYTIFSLITTGHPLPNTFYAKAGNEHFFSWRTLQETIRLHWLDNPVSFLLIIPGFLPTWRRSRLTIWWLIASPVLTAFIVDFVWHHGRYTMPLIPFQMIVAAFGGQWLLDKIIMGNWKVTLFQENRSSYFKNYKTKLPEIILILVFITGGLWRVPLWANMLGSNTREILEIDVALGHWLKENTSKDAVIAVDDIGAVTFISQRRIVDLNGLVSPEMWPAVKADIGLKKNQIAARILSDIAPDIMAVFPMWHWDIASNPAVAQPIYHLKTSSRTIIGDQEVILYRMNWPYLDKSSPQNPLIFSLDDKIQMLGYDLHDPLVGSPLTLNLYWQSLEPVTADYDVFVHVVDETGEIVAQVDQKPVRGLASTNMWQSGDIIRDQYLISSPPDLPVKQYELRAGMYLRETGQRLRVQEGVAVENAIVLTKLVWGS